MVPLRSLLDRHVVRDSVSEPRNTNTKCREAGSAQALLWISSGRGHDAYNSHHDFPPEGGGASLFGCFRSSTFVFGENFGEKPPCSEQPRRYEWIEDLNYEWAFLTLGQ